MYTILQGLPQEQADVYLKDENMIKMIIQKMGRSNFPHFCLADDLIDILEVQRIHLLCKKTSLGNIIPIM